MGDHHHGPAKGLSRWLFTTNHKDIGTMYLVFALIAGLIGGAMSVYMRMELMDPGVQYMCEEGARFIANANATCTPKIGRAHV